MGALGIPSAADIERLTRRLRSVSQRLEAIEDALDRVDGRLDVLDALDTRLDGLVVKADAAKRPDSVDRRLEELRVEVAALRESLTPSDEPVPRAQERLTVTES